MKETHEVEFKSAIFSPSLLFRVLLRDAGFANTHTLGLEKQDPEKDERKRGGKGSGVGGEEGDERQRQHPRGGARRAPSPTVGAPFLLQLLDLLQAEPGAFVDAEISQNFLHSLCVRVLHGWGREQQMVPRLFFFFLLLLSGGEPPPQPTAPVLSP